MPSFGKRSQSKLDTCHPDLQKVFNEVVKHFDCSIICGRRDCEEQNNLYHAGKSQLQFPDSKHNTLPSNAVDAIPYPVDWNDREQFSYFAGFVIGIAASMGIKLRWGGDWDMDGETTDNSFDDLPHIELI